LTIIGIFIGISAVVGLISLGQGMQDAITKQLQELGADKITISPGSALFGPQAAFTTSKLTENDLRAVKRVRGVDNAGGLVMSTSPVEFKNERKTTFITGIPLDDSLDFIEESQSFKIIKGRDLIKGDRYRAVIGYAVAQGNFFSKEVNIRDKLVISGQEFKVVGILGEIGNQMDDSSIVIPIDIARELFSLEDEYRYIVVEVKPREEPSEVAEKIKKELRKERGVKEGAEDFNVQTFEDIVDSLNSILGIITAVFIGIAAISLLVGGVGIMNTMYTSVLERTRDIGIMKAVGAKDRDIMIIFLFESGLIGLFGGIIGCIIGIILAVGATQVAASAGYGFLEAKISAELILFAVGFSFFVGAISGILPARRASKLQPVEALRNL
jgi:putative ABC transport system permease protein